MKKVASVVILMLLVVAMVVPVSAAGWDKRVSGGAYATAGGIDFTVTLSAWEKPDGTFGGEGQYARDDLTFHLDVTKVCFSTDLDAAAAIGTVRRQDGGPLSSLWGGIAVKDDGSGDRVRVRINLDETEAAGFCSSLGGSYPGTVLDGNFHIRSK
jgi:hypothetical protein